MLYEEFLNNSSRNIVRNPIVYYLGFLATISNSQIIQWMLFCPDRLPVIRVDFPDPKTNSSRSRIYRTSFVHKIIL